MSVKREGIGRGDRVLITNGTAAGHSGIVDYVTFDRDKTLSIKVLLDIPLRAGHRSSGIKSWWVDADQLENIDHKHCFEPNLAFLANKNKGRKS